MKLEYIARTLSRVLNFIFEVQWWAFRKNKMCILVYYGDNLSSETGFKEIVSYFNSIFLCHMSEDMNQKRLFPKFQFIPILHFQVMEDYVHWYCP